jgi:hypothetical protein
MTSFRSLKSEIFDREERKQQYQAHILGLNAYDRHKKFLKDYVSFYGKENSRSVKLPVKTDQDTLREGYRFIRTEEDDLDPSWEQRLVKRYYDKLFKEYPFLLAFWDICSICFTSLNLTACLRNLHFESVNIIAAFKCMVCYYL